MNNEILIRLEQAGVKRNDRWLVRDLDICLARGEILTLIGPNGSGKSTTVRLMAGILKADMGRSTRANGLRIGYVPQSLKTDWTLPLSVSRFLQLTCKLSPDDVTHALLRTGVDHLVNAQVHTLSGGEFQRVLLARALAQKPDVMILDEPTQGVDFAGERALYELIASLRDELGTAIVLVSHDLHLVMASTDRVLCLNGHICCQGAPQVVAESAEYQHLFGGAGALAFYRHHHDHEHGPGGIVKPHRHAGGGYADNI